MSLITHTAPPTQKPPKQLSLPRLMQGSHTGTVYLITAVNGEGGKAEGVALYHAPAPAGGPPWQTPPNMAIGQWGGDITLELLKDYGRVLSMQNDG